MLDIRYSNFCSKKNDSGFTLLELMISIALVGIILVILMAVLRLGFRSVEAGGKKIESLERVRVALNLLDAQIQSATSLGYEENGENKSYFKGEPTSLEFSSNYSIWEGERGYVVVSYTVASGDQGKPYLLASENIVGSKNKKEIKLLDQFDKLFFEYYYQDPTVEGGRWVDRWTEPTQQPNKIRLHIVKAGKDLALIIPMKIGETSDVVQATMTTPGSPLKVPVPVPKKTM